MKETKSYSEREGNAGFEKKKSNCSLRIMNQENEKEVLKQKICRDSAREGVGDV